MTSGYPPAVPPNWPVDSQGSWIVGVLGASETEHRRLHRRLSPNWSIVPLIQSEFLDRSVAMCHVLCVLPSSHRGGQSRVEGTIVEGIDDIEVLAEELQVPVVVLLSDLEPATVLGLRDLRARHLLVDWIRYGNLSANLKEIAVRPFFEGLAETVRSMVSDEPILGATLGRLVRQIPPPAPVAMEAPEFRFIRKVKQLPSLAGCSRSHLYAMASTANLSLGEFLRANTLLHGVALRESGSTNEIAMRLSFPSAEAWRAFLRRELGGAADELVEASIWSLAERLRYIAAGRS